MTSQPARALAQLDALYATFPTMQCAGKCQAACGSIAMTPLERHRIVIRHGRRLPLAAAFADNGERCPALDQAGRCTVYTSRPLVCRLWGLVESMPCPHGCRPEGGWMSEEDGRLALARVEELGGDRRRAARLRSAPGTTPGGA